MTLFLLLFIGSYSLFGQEIPTLPEKSKFRIILLAGQSNMAGRGFVQEEDKIPIPRVLTMNRNGEWVPSIEPTHFDKNSAGTCLGRTFALMLAQSDPSITVGIVPAACGGTSITDWKPGQYYAPTNSRPYDDAVARTKKALEKGTLAAILWHQGESDTNEKRAKIYHDLLLELFQSFRGEFNAPDVPILVGALYPRKGIWFKTVTDAQKQIVEESAPAAFVEANDMTLNPDKIHFDRKSLIKFGADYYRQYERLVKQNKKKSQ